jgi:putative DNA primase/helicase
MGVSDRANNPDLTGVKSVKKALNQAVKEMNWALKSESAPRQHAMLSLTQSEPGIPILPQDMDRDPWLLNVLNGTLDLRTGELRSHRQEDLITKVAPVRHDPDALCETWKRFLASIFADDQDMVEFMKRWFGHCLTGDVREQILPIFWGKGANGKSTMLNVIMDIMGEDYAIKATRDLFMNKKADSHPTQMARLHGRRLVVCIETQEGARLDEGLVKELTGGDKITARRMREDYWQFDPTHKCVLVTNHKPEISGTDEGIWRRPKLVPFTQRFWDADKGENGPDHLRADKTLSEKLKAEAEGILRWCVEGCLAWQSEGLKIPAAVQVATTEYRGQQDTLAAFIDENCTIQSDAKCRASKFRICFSAWAEQNGEKEPPSQRRLGQALTEYMSARGAPFQRMKNNGVWYKGIALSTMFSEKKERKGSENDGLDMDDL